MKYEDAIVEFLAQKDNLELALQVSEHLEAVKRQLHSRFWSRCRDLLQERLCQMGAGKSWTVRPDDDKDPMVNDDGIWVDPSHVEQAVHLTYGLVQWFSGEFSLYLKVTTSKGDGLMGHEGAELDELRSVLADENCRKASYAIGWQYVRKYQSHNSFLLEAAEKAEVTARNAVDVLADLIEKSEAAASKVNSWLKANP